jgi:hypothetical protein
VVTRIAFVLSGSPAVSALAGSTARPHAGRISFSPRLSEALLL